MKQSIKMLLHLAFWMGYFLLMAIVLFAARQGNDIPPEDHGYFASFIVQQHRICEIMAKLFF